MHYETFCGGIFETNCYLLEAPEGPILFDAPDGACDWLVAEGITPKLLLLTHGHFDHIPDAAKIKSRFGCPIGCHAIEAAAEKPTPTTGPADPSTADPN